MFIEVDFASDVNGERTWVRGRIAIAYIVSVEPAKDISGAVIVTHTFYSSPEGTQSRWYVTKQTVSEVFAMMDAWMARQGELFDSAAGLNRLAHKQEQEELRAKDEQAKT